MSTVHVIGAGLAGLSAALALVDAGRNVTVYEAGPQAGGRCRSYFDRELGCRVDNGNHLLLSGNTSAMAFLERTGARATMGGPGRAEFPFIDLADGTRWTVRPNAGRLPWWVLVPSRRVPGTRAADYLSLNKLARPGAEATIGRMLPPGALTRRLMEPLAIAALNTPPDIASAALLAPVVKETLMRGGDACIPLLPRIGLSESLIDPALAALEAKGVPVRFGCRVGGIVTEAGRAVQIGTPDGPVPLQAGDSVCLAVPPWAATGLVPGITAPDAHQAIVNVHFRIEPGPTPAGAAGFMGVISGTAEWIFVKPGHVSITISAANRLVDEPSDTLAAMVWPDTAAALALPGPMPPWRVVKEKRATFEASSAQNAKRPGPLTHFGNIVLAGDWTATGLPATIEGAIWSGRTAAAAVLARF